MSQPKRKEETVGKEMRGTEALAYVLKELGVKRVFSTVDLPELVRGELSKANLEVEQSHSAKASALMAYTYAVERNDVGTVIQVPGNRLLDGTDVIGQAFMESVPLLVIGTIRSYRDVSRARVGELRTNEDLAAILSPVTKVRERIISIEELTVTLQKAYNDALSNRPRPVLVEIAEDLFKLKAFPLALGDRKPERKTPDKNTVMKAVELLINAQRPVALAGYGVLTSSSSSDLVQLAETLDMPVITTVKGKGVIPSSHPLFAGEGLGSMGTEATNRLVEEADVILALGTRFTQLSTGGWSFKFKGLLIHNTVDGEDIGKSYVPHLPAVADTGLFLKELVKGVKEKLKSSPSRGTPEVLRKLKREPQVKPHSGLWPIDVVREVEALGYRMFVDIDAATVDFIRSRVEKPWDWITSESLIASGIGVAGPLESKDKSVGVTTIRAALNYFGLISHYKARESIILVMDDSMSTYLDTNRSDSPSIGSSGVRTELSLSKTLNATEVTAVKELEEALKADSKGLKIIDVKLEEDYESVVLPRV